MSEVYGPFGLSYEDEERRLHNVQLCEQFLEISGSNRAVDRMDICTDTGSMVLTYAYGGNPRETPPLGVNWKQLSEMTASGTFSDRWPYWRLSNGVIHSTPNPDIIFIECDGQSMLYDDACHGDYGYYLNHYILTMTFKDGKIDFVHELYNTAAVYDNFGWNREPKIFL